MERRKFVAGNWKMNKTLPEALELVTELKRLVAMVRQVDIAIIPPSLFVPLLSKRLEDSRVQVGVQNIHETGFGAVTGELSADMLKTGGASWCLAGHSERRQFFGETDEIVNRKVKALYQQEGVSPIMCIGETLADREGDKTFSVLDRQLSIGLEGLTAEQTASLVLAYEPVWAIGTGRTASAEQVEEVHTWIRNYIEEKYTSSVSQQIRIQYGGSVKPDNARQLLHTPNVDGALVGGASLKPESFTAIVKAGIGK